MYNRFHNHYLEVINNFDLLRFELFRINYNIMLLKTIVDIYLCQSFFIYHLKSNNFYL